MNFTRRAVLGRQGWVSAVFWGVVAALCVPPMVFGPMIALALAGALSSLATRRGWQAFRWGAVWGLTFHLGTLFWIRNVMAVGPVVAIGVGVALLMLYLSLFSALWAWSWTRLRDRGLWWLWPFAFAGIEILRGFGQMSFPWSHIGYGFGNWTVLLQGTSITGIHGLGFLLASTSAILVRPCPRNRMRWTLGILAFWSLWVLFGTLRLTQPETGVAIRVGVVQPAIAQTRKWDESYFRNVMDKTFQTASAARGPLDLLVFPETAIPDFWSLRAWEASRFRRLGDSLGTDIVVGALAFDRDTLAPKGAWIRNSAYFLPRGEFEKRYDKIRLVPFSERLPFDDVFPVLNYVDLGEGDFSAGDSLPVFKTRGLAWAPTICYELIYPDFARQAVRNGARAMVDITNDGWFGRSLGPWQHWNIERFRAVESGLPLVRSANTGISGIVDSKGRLLASLDLMDSGVVEATIHEGRPTFAGRHGAWIEGFLAALGLLALIASSRRSSKEARV